MKHVAFIFTQLLMVLFHDLITTNRQLDKSISSYEQKGMPNLAFIYSIKLFSLL